MKSPKAIGKVQPVYKVWLSKDEAMAYLGCSDKFLERLRREALVVFSQYGKMIWYNAASLNHFLNRQAVIKNSDVVK
ncbi:DNA-binding protein [Bacteroides thetaiotaomicron]|nr:DNA-binding protein [Bacteroides thetaiotaomicron]